MKFTLPGDAFPEVNLSKEHQEALTEEADTIIRETLAANEAFLADGATFKDKSWRRVCTKDGLSVYHQKQSSTGSSRKLNKPKRSGSFSLDTQLASQSTHPSALGHKQTSSEEASVSSFASDKVRRPGGFHTILHGTVDGTLDDCMYGTFAATNQSWMWRSSHIKDRLDDARVLATIRKPTKQDPFQFLGVKWFVKERPVMLAGIVQQRDYLILEATGLAHDSKGERVGYYLMHSIALPGIIPNLDDLGLLRGELSLCFIDRQSGPGKVTKYCRGFGNPKGKVPDRVGIAIMADSLICAAKVVDYAYIKKLTWFMKNERQSQREPSGSRPKRCQVCSKSFAKFGFTTAGYGSSCQICHRALCSKCSVTKKMTVDVSDTGAVNQCTLRFCLGCVREAKEKCVWEMALSGVETSSEASSGSGSARSGPLR